MYFPVGLKNRKGEVKIIENPYTRIVIFNSDEEEYEEVLKGIITDPTPTLEKINKSLKKQLLKENKILLAKYYDLSQLNKSVVDIINTVLSKKNGEVYFLLSVNTLVKLNGEILRMRFVKPENKLDENLIKHINLILDKPIVKGLNNIMEFLTKKEFEDTYISFDWKRPALIIIMKNGITKYFENVRLEEVGAIIKRFIK